MSNADEISRLLLALPVVILVCRAGAAALRRLGQPAVVGEITAGILLGPSLLGQVWPQAREYLFPPGVVDHVEALGHVGLLVFMFLIGLELNAGRLRGSGRTVALASQAGIVLPMALGAAVALPMYGSLAPASTNRAAFVLFVAVAMSVTAFPVLARILADSGLHRTPLGSIAMTCAAVTDIVAWCLLAAAVAVASGGTPSGALGTVALVAAYCAVLWLVVRPALDRVSRNTGEGSRGREDSTGRADSRGQAGSERGQISDDEERRAGLVLALLFAGVCVSALVTDAIGVHAVFGAFLFGVIVPRRRPVVERCAGRLGAVTGPLLLPLFFVTTGLRTDLGALTSDPAGWLWTPVLLAVAVVGKGGGTAVAARLDGRPWREALTLGALMNCRGLTELIVLNIGLDLGVIGPELFTMLVLVALLTTAATAPALRALGAWGQLVDALREPSAKGPAARPAV